MKLLPIILLLAGCSATREIGEAARRIDGHAANIESKLDAAMATGAVTGGAVQLVADARASATAIREDAGVVADKLADVKDKETGIFAFIRNAFWLIIIVAIIFAAVYFAPVLRPVIHWIGAILNLIPRPIILDAQSDAQLVVDEKHGKVKLPKTAVRAIELKSQDARYRKAFRDALAHTASRP